MSSYNKKLMRQCKKIAVGQSMIQEVHQLAITLGWRHVNKDEQRLIETLRNTSLEGRACVMQYAEVTRKASPWPTAPFRREG